MKHLSRDASDKFNEKKPSHHGKTSGKSPITRIATKLYRHIVTVAILAGFGRSPISTFPVVERLKKTKKSQR